MTMTETNQASERNPYESIHASFIDWRYCKVSSIDRDTVACQVIGNDGSATVFLNRKQFSCLLAAMKVWQINNDNLSNGEWSGSADVTINRPKEAKVSE